MQQKSRKCILQSSIGSWKCGKFQFMVLGTGKVNSHNLFIDGVKISCSKEGKLLEITIDNQLLFIYEFRQQWLFMFLTNYDQKP